jgi:hypothetical protein
VEHREKIRAALVRAFVDAPNGGGAARRGGDAILGERAEQRPRLSLVAPVLERVAVDRARLREDLPR